MSKSKLIREAVKNHLGQTLRPGDIVLLVTAQHGGPYAREGFFEGYYPGLDGNPSGFAVTAPRRSWSDTQYFTYTPNMRVYKLAPKEEV